MPRVPDRTAVFLNVPFDPHYEPLFIALIGSLVALGRTPRCVLEIPDRGQGRLSRLLDTIAECRVSLHDLSRVGVPVRFNMPFELGLACALAERHGTHDYILFERIPYRLDRTLSDLKGRDPHIHGGTTRGVLVAVFDAFASARANPRFEDVSQLVRDLQSWTTERKARQGATTVFGRTLFFDTVFRAVDLAQAAGMIR